MSGFMAQAGTILVGGDAAESLGDSLYEGRDLRRREDPVAGPPTPRVEELTSGDVRRVRELAAQSGFSHISAEDVNQGRPPREACTASTR